MFEGESLRLSIITVPGVQTSFGGRLYSVRVIGFLSCPPIDDNNVAIFTD